mmetsp:Transcript_134667/g.430119  ORF Transcript_134667/g.430119 Transcript_134667/m.430119 type:complete len:173 (-) Transcript_134667:271-789(-)
MPGNAPVSMKTLASGGKPLLFFHASSSAASPEAGNGAAEAPAAEAEGLLPTPRPEDARRGGLDGALPPEVTAPSPLGVEGEAVRRRSSAAAAAAPLPGPSASGGSDLDLRSSPPRAGGPAAAGRLEESAGSCAETGRRASPGAGGLASPGGLGGLFAEDEEAPPSPLLPPAA